MEKSTLVTDLLGAACHGIEPVSVAPLAIDDETVNAGVEVVSAAVTFQEAVACAVFLELVAWTTKVCGPVARPLTATGLEHAPSDPPSSVHDVVAPPVAVNATVASLLVVELGGLLVILTLSDEPASARPAPRIPIASMTSATTTLADGARLVRRGWGAGLMPGVRRHPLRGLPHSFERFPR